MAAYGARLFASASSRTLPYVGVALTASTAAASGTMFFHNSWSGDDTATTACESSSFPKAPQTERVPKLQTRMTSVGRWSLVSETSSNLSIPVLVLALAGAPFTPKDFDRLYHEREIAARHPRFAARLNGQETHFIHDHIKENETSDDKVVTDSIPRLANVSETVFPVVPRRELMLRAEDASSTPIDLQKSLWEVKTCTGGRIGQSGAISRDLAKTILLQEGHDAVESLLMFRAHHCLADGVSLSAIFSELMDEGPELQAIINQKLEEIRKRAKAIKKKLSLGPRSPWDVLKEEFESGERLSSTTRRRHISWVQMAPTKQVQKVAAAHSKSPSSSGRRRHITVNDVLASCVSAAISKQLAYHRATKADKGDKKSKPLPELKQMNLVVPVHVQGGVMLPGESLGNRIGAMVCDIPAEMNAEGSDCLSRCRLLAIHDRLSSLKQTPIAIWSYALAKLFGRIASRRGDVDKIGGKIKEERGGIFPWLFTNAHAKASVVLTNIRGPEKPLHLDGRRVEATLGILPLPPGIPIGVVVNSYAGSITLSVTAEPWAVPDANLFATWILEEYKNLLSEAEYQ